MPASALLKLQIGPVRDFLAQASKARDLWAASWIVSHLARTGMRAVQGCAGAEWLYPVAADPEDPLESNTPNVFLVRLPAADAERIALAAEEAIRDEWRRIADATAAAQPESHERAAEAGGRSQAGAFPIVEWVAHLCPADGETLKLLARGEPPLPAQAPDYTKPRASLDGLHAAAAEWKFAARRKSRAFPARGSEPLRSGNRGEDQLALIQQRFPEAWLRDACGWPSYQPGFEPVQQLVAAIDAGPGEPLPAGSPEYFAILALDGDDMSRWSLGCKGTQGDLDPLRPGYVEKLTQRLAAFGVRAGGIVSQFAGQAMHLGGDAVLALLPAANALACAEELARAFAQALPGGTASAGIGYGHVRAPLRDAVRAAFEAKAAAKRVSGKDGVCLRILKPRGEHLELALRWRSGTVKVWRELEDRAPTLGPVFAQRLAERLAPLFASRSEGHDSGWERQWTDTLRQAALLELTHGIQRHAELPRAEAEALAQTWQVPLTRLTPRGYLQFWLAWAFLRRVEEVVELPGTLAR